MQVINFFFKKSENNHNFLTKDSVTIS